VTHPPKKAVIPPHASFVLLQNGSSGFIKSNIVDVDDVLPSCPVLCIFCEVELINYPCSLLCVDCAGRSYSYGKLHEPAPGIKVNPLYLMTMDCILMGSSLLLVKMASFWC